MQEQLTAIYILSATAALVYSKMPWQKLSVSLIQTCGGACLQQTSVPVLQCHLAKRNACCGCLDRQMSSSRKKGSRSDSTRLTWPPVDMLVDEACAQGCALSSPAAVENRLLSDCGILLSGCFGCNLQDCAGHRDDSADCSTSWLEAFCFCCVPGLTFGVKCVPHMTKYV